VKSHEKNWGCEDLNVEFRLDWFGTRWGIKPHEKKYPFNYGVDGAARI
jgi:hypothetical protein